MKSVKNIINMKLFIKKKNIFETLEIIQVLRKNIIL